MKLLSHVGSSFSVRKPLPANRDRHTERFDGFLVILKISNDSRKSKFSRFRWLSKFRSHGGCLVISVGLGGKGNLKFTSIQWGADITSIPLRLHSGFTFHLHLTSMSLRFQFVFTSISLRPHFDFTSISFLFHHFNDSRQLESSNGFYRGSRSNSCLLLAVSAFAIGIDSPLIVYRRNDGTILTLSKKRLMPWLSLLSTDVERELDWTRPPRRVV